MKKLKRLWRAFEEPYGVRGVREDWHKYTGAEFVIASQFLRKLKEPSAIYPCPRWGGDGCPRKVVVHGPEDIVGVCGCAPKACDTVRLLPEHIVVYEMDLRRFCAFLAQALGLASVGEPALESSGVWNIGTWAPNVADHLPVFFVARHGRPSFEEAINHLLVSFQAAFVVLVQTSRFTGATPVDALKRRRSPLISLEDVLLLSGEGKLTPSGTLSELLDKSRSAAGDSGEVRNAFRRDQDFWTLIFAGKSVRLKHSVGLSYSSELLRLPGKEIEAIALTGGGDNPSTEIQAATGGIEMADAKTIGEVKKLLAERRAELAANAQIKDWARKGELKEEIAKIEQYLKETQGHAGKARRVAGGVEKARKAAGNAIARAIKDIQPHHPELARHLKDSIRMGVTLAYLPGTPTDWTL